MRRTHLLLAATEARVRKVLLIAALQLVCPWVRFVELSAVCWLRLQFHGLQGWRFRHERSWRRRWWHLRLHSCWLGGRAGLQ